MSSLYESAAFGMGVAPPFINAVAEVVALLRPRDLLERMQAIEAEFGRTLGHNESREIDLDLIAYGDEVRESGNPILPHPRFRERAFVLVPLAEIAPSFRDPRSKRTVAELIADLADVDTVRRVSGRRWIERE